jgi:hypothetical protein
MTVRPDLRAVKSLEMLEGHHSGMMGSRAVRQFLFFMVAVAPLQPPSMQAAEFKNNPKRGDEW